MKKLSLFIISLLVVGLLAACGTSTDDGKGSTSGSESEDKKVLKMATSADYPPFEYIDTAKGSDIIGFDIDLANALAEKTGYEIEVQDMDFNSLIPALQAKQIDIVLSGMTPTPEREENVDFSDIYYTANHMIISLKDKEIKSLEELEGKTIGVQLGSIQEEKATEISEQVDLKIENRNKISDLIQELKSGRIDAAIIEDLVANGYIEKDKDLAGFTLNAPEDEAGSAIAFQKDSKYTEEFNEALNEMKENGELEDLVSKWFGGEE
ncbi:MULTISPECIES: transporter substrate-binding domain-containing protein [Metabacillus]|uniref:ABC transporter substrate-binding protein n=3 Tax=Metabacillus TaxID=2675233 RepID=A0A179T0U7_9BACI|nr:MULTISPECIES: transporter substrate-binding domain-containing protein [Metabacillus]OAS87505.1 ABC transporter substrate-binding protein [Metabacillus litoralis]QNF26092.1 transporter substrate-binding domain-containing protein [Metabacillus sp. KUDC1714]